MSGGTKPPHGGTLKRLEIRVPITPVPKGRPRFRAFRGRVHTFTPAKTAKYEKEIADYYKHISCNFKFDRDQPICISIAFGMPIPKSAPKSRRQAMTEGILRHIKKPDVDNLAKAVLDALNGIAWEDDSQIVRLTAWKEYSTEPYVYMFIHESVD